MSSSLTLLISTAGNQIPCLRVPDYEVSAALDNTGLNIGQNPLVLSGSELEAASSACDANPSCQSFNTAMTLKGGSSVTAPSVSGGGCLYIKQGVIKIQPDDNNTCLSNSSRLYCDQCAQLPLVSDQASCYRCLSSTFFSPLQCITALKDKRLLNYSSGLIELVYPNASVISLCSALNSGSSTSIAIFSSDNLIYNTLLSAIRSNSSVATRALRLKIDDAMPVSNFLSIKYSPNCSSLSGFFRPNATGNWSFLAYGDDGIHLWVGAGATYGEHVLNSLLSIDRTMEWVASRPLSLSAGVMYPMMMRICRCGSPSRMSLLFTGPVLTNWTSDGRGFYFHSPSDSGSLPPAPPLPPLPPPAPPSPPPAIPILPLPTSSASPSPSNDGSSSSSTNLPLIIGVSVGGSILILLIGLSMLVYRRRKQPQSLQGQIQLKKPTVLAETSSVTTSNLMPLGNSASVPGSPLFLTDDPFVMVAQDQVSLSVLSGLQTSNRCLEINPSELEVIDRVGVGAFGQVFRGRWRGAEVAIKRYHQHKLDQDFMEEFKSEIEMMSSLAHINIVQLLGFVVMPGQLAIVSEYIRCGSLYDLLHGTDALDYQRRRSVDSHQLLSMALDVCHGMDYLHSRSPPVVHRDLKSSNLLVENNFRLRICDFGLSRVLNGDYIPSTQGMGTVQWTAPEVMTRGRVSEKSDVYSFGVVLWEMVTLERPWEGMRPEQVVFAVGGEGLRPTLPTTLQPEVVSLIQDCWRAQPKERPLFSDIIKRLKAIKELKCAAAVAEPERPNDSSSSSF